MSFDTPSQNSQNVESTSHNQCLVTPISSAIYLRQRHPFRIPVSLVSAITREFVRNIDLCCRPRRSSHSMSSLRCSTCLVLFSPSRRTGCRVTDRWLQRHPIRRSLWGTLIERMTSDPDESPRIEVLKIGNAQHCHDAVNFRGQQVDSVVNPRCASNCCGIAERPTDEH